MKTSILSIRQPRAAFNAIYAGMLCAMLAGCNVGPKYAPPAITAPAVYKESPT